VTPGWISHCSWPQSLQHARDTNDKNMFIKTEKGKQHKRARQWPQEESIAGGTQNYKKYSTLCHIAISTQHIFFPTK